MHKQSFISLAGYKGGVGKTTTAIHLGGFLSEYGNTVIVDGDRTRNATYWHRGGRLSTVITTPSSIARVAGEFEYVVVDSRGGLEEEDLFELAEASDLLILPSSIEVLSLDAMAQTAEALEDKGFLSKTRVLLTMTRPGRKLEQARVLLGELGLVVFDSTARHSEAFRDAALAGVLVRDTSSALADRCWEDYVGVGRSVLEFLEVPGVR